MLLTEFTVRCIAGHWHMVVTERGKEQTYPAASRVGAEIMVSQEKKRRGLPIE